MKILHAIIALVFVLVGLSLYTTTDRVTDAFLALLIANVSLAALAIERAMDKGPIERDLGDGATDGEPSP